MPPKGQVRVRIAPSPTGYLHIGTARTALFNWLFAKKHKGVFLVRIEDTDKERSKPEYEKDILDELKWLGLNWDEFYRQSERGEIYKKYLKKLLDERHAYYCFCTKDELEAQKQSMLANGHPPKYSGRCRSLSEAEVKKNLVAGKDSVIRFKMPEGQIAFTDMVRGKVVFDMALIGDIVVAKDESSPLYNLAAAIDDYEMKISQVIRAEDHLPNTPKQIAFLKALGLPAPEYAHLPLILNADRSKMSKRYEATAVSEYRTFGYLSESLVNFLALLGWHPAPKPSFGTGQARLPMDGKTAGQLPIKEQEIFTRGELIEEFDLNRVQKAGAVFDPVKLDWINSQHIKKLDASELYEKISSIIDLSSNLPKSKILKIIELERERLKKLSDFKELADFFFKVTDYPKEMLIWKETAKDKILENLKAALAVFEKADTKAFTREQLQELLKPLSDERGRGEVLWPLRVALSGREASPGPFEIMEILGKAETLMRVKNAVRKLEATV